LKKLFLATITLTALIATGANADINIAVVGPMTGQYAKYGAQMKNGAEMAVADINANGGINGRKLKLLVGDDACDPKQAVAIAHYMAGKAVQFVSGHYCSDASIPASKIYEEEGIIQISPASTHPKLTDEGGPNVYRVCGREDQQGRVAGTFLARQYAGKKIAVVHNKTEYGKGLADDTVKALKAGGLKPALYEAIDVGEENYSALLAKLKKEGIHAVFLGGSHTEAGLIIRQMRDMGMKTVLMGGDALVKKELWTITGKAGSGTLMTSGPDPRKTPIAANIVRKFRNDKIEPEGYVLYTYGTVQAWAQAARKAKSATPARVIPKLNSSTFDTVLGRFSFDKNGDASNGGYVVYKYDHKGQYDYY